MGGVEGSPISAGSGAERMCVASREEPANYPNYANAEFLIRVIRWPILFFTRWLRHENPQDARGPSTPPMLPRSAQDDKNWDAALALETIRKSEARPDTLRARSRPTV